MRKLPIYKTQVKSTQKLQGGKSMVVNFYTVGTRETRKGQMLTLSEMRRA